MRQHIHAPRADDAIRAHGNNIVRILCPHDVNAVHWMRVAVPGEWRLLYGRLFGASIPQQDLSAVRPAQDEIRVEGREFGAEEVGGGMKRVFGTGGHVLVPNENKAWRSRRRGGVFGVGGEEEFGELPWKTL